MLRDSVTLRRVDVWPAGPLPIVPPGVAPASQVTFVQAVAASYWVIVHNLGRYPGGIIALDANGNMLDGSVSYPEPSTVVITFAAAVVGCAYLA